MSQKGGGGSGHLREAINRGSLAGTATKIDTTDQQLEREASKSLI